MSLKAVFFDMDGLVLDSEYVFYREFHEALLPYGIDLPMERFVQLLGRRSPEITQLFHEMYPDFPDYDAFSRDFDIPFLSVMKTEPIPVKKGCSQLLDVLSERGIKKYIVTSSDLPYTKIILGNAGMYPRFDEIITGEMVENSKPAPDMYLHAMDVSGTSPDECLVLEDSIAGCMSAVNAGIKVICIPDLLTPPDEVVNKCYRVLGSLDEVIPLLNEM